jgi:hypothetical protein
MGRIIGACDMMVTPIYDPNWKEWWDPQADPSPECALTSYKAKAFQEYLERGWCRLEMFFNANMPFNTERERYFGGRLKQVMDEEKRRPHLVFGTREQELGMLPVIMHAVTPDEFVETYHPGRGKLTDQRDGTVIGAYVQELDKINRLEKYDPPSNLLYVYPSGHKQVFPVGTDVHIAPRQKSLKGTHLVFSISPALPQGLQMSPETGVISGTVREVHPWTNYTVKAMNMRGSASTIIHFATVPYYRQTPMDQWTPDMVRAWLEDFVKAPDHELLELHDVDGRVLAACSSAASEPLASKRLAETTKMLISMKVRFRSCML